jgi:predicted nucleic-acid-binding Zn-ribbon protein
MTVADNDLTPEDKAEILAWLRDRWSTQRSCPICSHNNWVVGGHLVTPIITRDGGIQLGSVSYPYFMISCSNCGHTHFFSAVIARLRAATDKTDRGGDDDTS